MCERGEGRKRTGVPLASGRGEGRNHNRAQVSVRAGKRVLVSMLVMYRSCRFGESYEVGKSQGTK